MSAPQELKGPDLAAGVDASGLKDGEPLLGHAAGEPIVLVRRQGEVCAVGAVCTHYGGPLAEGIVEGDTIRCPWHHARFDLRTGTPTRPGRDPIPCYRVERQNGRVRVGERLAPPRTVRSAGPESAIIVGAGAAGNACAEELRRQGYEGPITMFGSEGTPPVDRPNLSKDYLAGSAPEDWIPLRGREFYTERRIDLLEQVEVTALTSNGERCGCRPDGRSGTERCCSPPARSPSASRSQARTGRSPCGRWRTAGPSWRARHD